MGQTAHRPSVAPSVGFWHLGNTEENVAIIALFEVEGSTAAKYDEVIRRLTAIGQRVPDGQLYHVCYGDRERLQVIDVFGSPAKLEAFGATLMPILDEMGITARATVLDVYGIIDAVGGDGRPAR
jgi:hypothetical protein